MNPRSAQPQPTRRLGPGVCVRLHRSGRPALAPWQAGAPSRTWPAPEARRFKHVHGHLSAVAARSSRAWAKRSTVGGIILATGVVGTAISAYFQWRSWEYQSQTELSALFVPFFCGSAVGGH